MTKIEVQHVAITRTGEPLAMMQIITRAPLACFSIVAAGAIGFLLSEDGQWWERDGPLSDEQIETEITRSGLSNVTAWSRVAEKDIPTDRTFREAWTLGGKAVAVDMPRARDIHRERLRSLRAPLLAALDVEYQRADEAGDLTAKRAVAVKKQALRDMTKDAAIEAANSPDALKLVMPVALVQA